MIRKTAIFTEPAITHIPDALGQLNQRARLIRGRYFPAGSIMVTGLDGHLLPSGCFSVSVGITVQHRRIDGVAAVYPRSASVDYLLDLMGVPAAPWWRALPRMISCRLARWRRR